MSKFEAFFLNHRTHLLLFMGILVVYGLSFYQRQADYSFFWMNNSQDYVVEDVTLLASTDSYYWLKMARELDKGTLGKGQKEITKGYPDLQMLAIQDTPSLLAVLISFAKNFTDGDYYRAGIFLVPILSGLFVFPLFFYFNKLGFGASAIYGGLIATFGHAYYDRTMMGRVDTDLLNTFFPLVVACFILFMGREKSWRVNFSLSLGCRLDDVSLYLVVPATEFYRRVFVCHGCLPGHQPGLLETDSTDFDHFPAGVRTGTCGPDSRLATDVFESIRVATANGRDCLAEHPEYGCRSTKPHGCD